MRNPTFDIMKGIGILAVIIGHCSIPTLFRTFIFSWHMPLFFILGGFLYKETTSTLMIAKSARGLLLPYLCTCLVMSGLNYVFPYESSIHYHTITSIFIGSGSTSNPIMGDYFVGALWFLLALFWCRTIYNYISINIKNFMEKLIVIIILTILSIIISKYIFIPTDFLQGVAALPFYFVGNITKQNRIPQLSFIVLFVTIIFAIVSLLLPPVGMVRNNYPCYPINFVTAILLTLCIYHISYIISNKNEYISAFFAFIGKISILILCIHIVELDYDPIPNLILKLNISIYGSLILIVLFRIVSVLLVSYLLYKFKFVRKLFSLK